MATNDPPGLNGGAAGAQVHSWWSTLPGIITAITGLIGAITALLAALPPILQYVADLRQDGPAPRPPADQVRKADPMVPKPRTIEDSKPTLPIPLPPAPGNCRDEVVSDASRIPPQSRIVRRCD